MHIKNNAFISRQDSDLDYVLMSMCRQCVGVSPLKLISLENDDMANTDSVLQRQVMVVGATSLLDLV